MPVYLHQWTYKDTAVDEMIHKPEDRAAIVRFAVQTFKGKLQAFYLSFGEFDGMAITEFDSDETAYACVASIFGQGRLATLRTTPLFSSKAGLKAMQRAKKELVE
jgi:uncharacterized protein with GYD domain